ncbi:M23 family metallopeptidase [Paenibacillus sp. FSL W8-0426]|uniref:M23 family metallopeptidase n=1 Tax=Paenibacillus sp. FSL W8-0426 TaxID=2921714 RepID=UPI0030D7C108
MDTKLRVKQRREERIRRLLDGAAKEIMLEERPGFVHKEDKANQRRIPSMSDDIQDKPRDLASSMQERERDPELLWKQENGRYGPNGHVRFHFFKSLMKRTLVSAVLFGAVWGMFQWNASWTVSPKTAVADALHREMDFEAATAWYEKHFGGHPSFLPVFGHAADAVNGGEGVHSLLGKPISGTVVQPFAMSMKGIEIVPDLSGEDSVRVVSSDAGRVLQVLGDPESGITVVVQHTGGLTAIYGRLGESDVAVNDWLEAGGVVGSLPASRGEQPASLYFAIKEGDQYVDPAEVVALD